MQQSNIGIQVYSFPSRGQMKRFKRVAWIVLDSAGIGEMPDAAEWGDAGSDTLGHVIGFEKPHLPVPQKHSE